MTLNKLIEEMEEALGIYESPIIETYLKKAYAIGVKDGSEGKFFNEVTITEKVNVPKEIIEEIKESNKLKKTYEK